MTDKEEKKELSKKDIDLIKFYYVDKNFYKKYLKNDNENEEEE